MGWYLSTATHATKNKTMKKEFRTADETRTHTRHPWSERILSITNWKSIAFGLSILAIFISKLRHSRTLLLVIKQINCSSSLYTFISLLMLGSPSGFLPQPNSSVILHKCFHLWEDSLYSFPPCLPFHHYGINSKNCNCIS